MIDFFVKKPITTIMFILLFLVLGLVSFFNLNQEKSPKIDFPLVTVSLVYPGAAPQEMENLVIDKVEDTLSELSEVKKIRSQSFENFGFVFVEFLLSTDVNNKFIEVKDKVDSLLNKFPSGMKKPIVQKFDPFVQPVVDLVIASDTIDDKALFEIADQKLKDKILSIKGVANVEILGGKQRQINVDLDPILMKEQYISIEDVIRSVQTKNMNIPSGEIENSASTSNLKFIGEYKDLQDLANTQLVTRNGEIILLSSIAKIEDGFKKVEKIARYNGKNAVVVSIKKSSDSNAVKIAQDIKKRMPKFQALIPEGVSLDIAMDNTVVIERENYQTEMDILIGILLTVVILFLFTGNFRLIFIASITIPLSIISAFFLMDVFNFSINFLTLLAIASSLGTLISNAIVIIESFWSKIKLGENSYNAAIKGTKEVGVAVLAATGTNLVVFLPIAFMQGMVGRFMYSFGLTVIFVTLFSILVSFALIPMMCCYILKNQKVPSFVILKKPIAYLTKKYEGLFNVIFRFPKITVIVVILSFLSIRYVTPYISGNFMPKSDEDKIVIKAETPQGSPLEYTLDVTKKIEEEVKKIPEMTAYVSILGLNGTENVTVKVDLLDKKNRTRKDTDIIETLIPFLSKIADARIVVMRGGASKGMDEGDITLNICGKDYKKMTELSEVLKEKMADTSYFNYVASSYKPPKKELCFMPKQEELMLNNIRDSQVGMALRSSLYGDDTNIYKENGKEYNISIRLNGKYIKSLEDVNNINIITRKGLMPVTSLGKIVKQNAIPTIVHENKMRVIKLNGFLGKSNPGHVKKVLIESLKDISFDEDAYYSFAGMDEMQQESAKQIIKAFFLAVILTYMLLAAILNSFSYPISIIFSIVTSFTGVFYALFFLEESMNITSMLGMVMLVGLVINNSILLVDLAIIKMKEGIELKRALLEASKERLQMILMTSLAIILGVIPQLWATMGMKSSMGAVMVGGMLASIVFTFILTPISFYYIEKMKGGFRRLFKRRKAL